MHTDANVPSNDFATMRRIDAIGVPVDEHYLIRNRLEYSDEVREKLVRRVRLPRKRNDGNSGLRLTVSPT